MGQNAFSEILRLKTFVVEIVSNIEVVFWSWIEPRITCSWLPILSSTCIEIHTHHWILTETVIQSNIHDYRDSAIVRFIYKSFQSFSTSIGFIWSKIERWVITPAVVSFKLINWHQLNSCHTKGFKIIQRIS